MRTRTILISLIIVLAAAVPAAWVWTRILETPRFQLAFQHGYAQNYVEQRRSTLVRLDADLGALDACERAAANPCYPAVDALVVAARDEVHAITGQESLFFFPSCLRPAADREAAALGEAENTASELRTGQPAYTPEARTELGAVASSLARAAAALDATC